MSAISNTTSRFSKLWSVSVVSGLVTALEYWKMFISSSWKITQVAVLYLYTTSKYSRSHNNDLRVIVKSNLTWSEHVSSVCKLANSSLSLLRTCFSRVSFRTFCILCSVYVRMTGILTSPRTQTLRKYSTPTRSSYEEKVSMSNLLTFHQRLRGDIVIIISFCILKHHVIPITILIINTWGHDLKLKKEIVKDPGRIS